GSSLTPQWPGASAAANRGHAAPRNTGTGCHTDPPWSNVSPPEKEASQDYPDQVRHKVPPLRYTALHPTVPVPLLQRANDHHNQCSPSQWHKKSPGDYQGEAVNDMTKLVLRHHFCASSPLREARADNRRSGIGTPMSARFSMMLSASLPMYHQVVTVRRIGSPT